MSSKHKSNGALHAHLGTHIIWALFCLLTLVLCVLALRPEPKPSTPSSLASAVFTTDSYVRLSFMGDVMLGSWNHSSQMHQEYFQAVQPFLTHTDLNIVNLEGPIVPQSLLGYAKRCSSANCHSFAQLPQTAAFLRSSGTHIATVNNNHAFDVGVAGIQSTISYLQQSGILALTGSAWDRNPQQSFSQNTPTTTPLGSLAVSALDTADLTQPAATRLHVKGLPLSFITVGTTRGLVRFDDPRIMALIAQEARTHTVIVLGHVGCEGASAMRMPTDTAEQCFGENRGHVYAFGQQAARAGARLVVFHGPHVVRPMVLSPQGTLIAYSLGNFATAQGISVSGPAGHAPLLQVALNKDGTLARCRIISFMQQRPKGLFLDPQHQAFETINSLSASLGVTHPCMGQ